jgi:hypothetical protein
VSFVDVFKELEEEPREEDPVVEESVLDKGRACG